jgi:Na+-transporting methylmalonyl-CoA/oxaloacetate decarboxylase gamma subunit
MNVFEVVGVGIVFLIIILNMEMMHRRIRRLEKKEGC